MLDNSLIEKSSTESLLSDFISDRIETKNFYIEKNQKDNFWYMKNSKEEYYNILSVDTNNMVKTFARSLIDKNFDSILISGLGLGILPFLCQNTTKIVDVIEIEEEVVKIVEQIGHLKNNVRIFKGSILNFIPDRSYDIILFDHWMSHATLDEIDFLKNKFRGHLNQDGIITIPIYEQSIR
jgi:spermidine synthase